MNNIDLNINNYNLEDIQNLFKLDKYFTEPQLLKCKETVNKLHPSNSSLSIEYFNLLIVLNCRHSYIIYIEHK